MSQPVVTVTAIERGKIGWAIRFSCGHAELFEGKKVLHKVGGTAYCMDCGRAKRRPTT